MTLSNAERRFVDELLAAATNLGHVKETEDALASFPSAAIGDLLFQLGCVDLQKSAPPSVEFDADYYEIGKRIWNKSRVELHNAICGNDERYADERKRLKNHTESALIVLVPIILEALRIPVAASGVAVVLALLILKIGLAAFCATAGDFSRLRGAAGDVCEKDGIYMNLKESQIKRFRKGERFPPGSDGVEWVFRTELPTSNDSH